MRLRILDQAQRAFRREHRYQQRQDIGQAKSHIGRAIALRFDVAPPVEGETGDERVGVGDRLQPEMRAGADLGEPSFDSVHQAPGFTTFKAWIALRVNIVSVSVEIVQRILATGAEISAARERLRKGVGFPGADSLGVDIVEGPAERRRIPP